jgi:membrane protein CcdC involved in cytochrome C biogenesis
VRTRAAAILKARQMGIIPAAFMAESYQFEIKNKDTGS